MGLDDALAIAGGGLANISRQLAVVSQNVTNASTPDYTREVATQTSLATLGNGDGVHTGPTTRDIDLALQTGVFRQDGVVAGLTTRQNALQQIDVVQGQPGQGSDLASLVGALQDQLSSLGTDPSNATRQSAVVGAAQNLARQINDLAGSYTDARQSAQDTLVAGVATLNTTLSGIGQLSDQIMQLRATGASTADLENQRDAAMHSLSSLVDARFLERPNGDMLVMTSSGLSLPTRGGGAFATSAATVGAAAYYPGGGVPAVTLSGVDVTAQLTGGALGAAVSLRDSVLPGFQAGLDEFAHTLASRFDAQGLRLFTDSGGSVPSGGGIPAQAGYVGFSQSIQVNPAVVASPALVRDGTQSVTATPSGPTAFTPNPAGGPAGFATLVARVLSYALGPEVAAGVSQPAPVTVGLGPAGTLDTNLPASRSLADQATALVGAQSAVVADGTAQLTAGQQVQSALQTKLAAAGGVSVDSEMARMVQLQNAYGANARVITTLQALWTQLMAVVQ